MIAQFVDDLAHDRLTVRYGDGTQTRGSTHVYDLVDGFVLAGEVESRGICNLEMGERNDFNTIVDLHNHQLGMNTEPTHDENRSREDVRPRHVCGFDEDPRGDRIEPRIIAQGI